MSTHLLEQDLRRFRQGTMQAADLLAADRHLAACAVCAERLADAPHWREAVARLQTELADDEGAPCDYFDFAQKAAFVKGELDAAETRLARQHMELCAECCLELAELRAVSASLPRQREFAPPVRPSVWERFWEGLGSAWALPNSRWAIRAAGAVAVVVLAFWVTTFLRPLRKAEPVAPSVTPAPRDVPPPPAPPGEKPVTESAPVNGPPVALRDGAGQVTLDQQGVLRGLEALSPSAQQAIKTALTTQRVPVSAQLAQLHPAAGELLGNRQPAAEFALLAPVGQVVMTARPVLRWQALRGAASYYVTVYDANLRKVAASAALTVTQWTPEPALEHGRLYYWQVRALKDGQEFFAPAPSAPDARFKILGRAQIAELERAKTVQPSHLALGVLYARAGLLEEASREFQALAAANPGSPVAKQLLKSVQRQRR